MAQGSVGGGSQNRWKKQGVIYETPPPGGSPFTKADKPNPTRNDNDCWVADTPVIWTGPAGSPPVDPRAIVFPVGIIPDMLVTLKDPDKPIDESNIDEYHPLITFFNEVMAGLMNAPGGLKNKIKNLQNKQNAIDVWDYLKKRYP